MRIRLSISFLLAFSFVVLPLTAWAASVTLRWQANNESDVSGYNVYYGAASRNYNLPIPAGNVTAKTVDGLTAGKTYYFAITATDTSGNESGFSQEVTAKATASAPSTQPFSIVMSTRSDRSNSVQLNNRTISGNVYIFISPDANISRVVFSIDGSAHNTENQAPYDLGVPFDSRTLSNGTHKISARITDQGGSVQTVTANCTVSNATSSGSGSTSTAPPQTVRLSASNSSPVDEGRTVTLRASANGGGSATQYRFSYRTQKTSPWGISWTKWQLLRDWGTSSSFNWNTLDAAGTCQIQTDARNPADQRERIVTDTITMTIQPNRPDAATLKANRTSPINQGTYVWLSTRASGGTGSYEYIFMYRKVTFYSKGKWTVLRNWSSSSGVSWNTKGLNGKYQIYAGVRNAGSEAGASASDKMVVKIN